jgi:hemoglobin/transferrin/lactoferrin receptor protein
MTWGLGARALRVSALRLAVASGVATSAFLGLGIANRDAHAQEAAQTLAFSVPSGSLSQALTVFGSQSGLQVTYLSDVAAGKSSPGFQGDASPQQALEAILAGSGLTYSFPNTTTVAISAPLNDAGATLEGAIALDTINVSGGNAGTAPADLPYETAAPTAHISGKTIERFRGSSPADMFRGTPGVMSGEARNGAGSIDVNIRGMQGFGRVHTTVDGAENQMQVYQGYQGLSNRSFVDPDFLAGVDITKGASTDSWGNAGSVAMRTLSAADIVKPGETWGFRIKGGVGTNTGDKTVAGNKAGYAYTNPLSWDSNVNPSTATPSATGMDRPGLLEPTQGNASIVAARKGENFDLLAGYAYRKRNNYYAGENGPTARPKYTGYELFCYPSGECPYYYDNVVTNGGLTNYRGGEEVLNTALETTSWLFKLNPHLGDGQTLTLGYSGTRIESGERIASRESSEESQATQQEQGSGTSLDTVTAQYKWDPADNDLVQLKSNLFWNHMETRHPERISGIDRGIDGLPDGYRIGLDVDNWGYNISNLSKFDTKVGHVDFTYGFNYRGEELKGNKHFEAASAGLFAPGDGSRHETAGFVRAAYTPIDWLTLNGGLRYSHVWLNSRKATADAVDDNGIGIPVDAYKTDDGGYSPSAGVTIEPFEGAQLYVNYSSTLRFSSLFESAFAFTAVNNFAKKPERSRNWDLGLNLTDDGVLVANDKGMMKFGYFNWDVKDYLARALTAEGGLNVNNIHGAKFEGLEFSGRYEVSGFTADLAANYYLNIEYCRTAGTCGQSTLYGDYATNHVPPEYDVSLTLAQTFLEDTLTVGGRVQHVGPRPIGHGDVTAAGLQSFISPVIWEPYTLVDLFSEYKLNDNLTASFRVENLFDKYYVDPLSLVSKPSPGRTFYASLTAELGSGDVGGADISGPFIPGLDTLDNGERWSGFYAGAHIGGVVGHQWGSTTSLDGTYNELAQRESPDFYSPSSLLGGQLGYNWQFRNGLVLGLEGDWSKTYMKHREEVTAGATDNPDLIGGEPVAILDYDIDWTASLRAKVGYALSDDLLVYATGGLAMLRETESREQWIQRGTSGETQIFSVSKDTSFNRRGFTIGGGVEYALNDSWSIAADYSYSRFRRKKVAFKKALAGGGEGYSQKIGEETRTYVPDPVACSGILQDFLDQGVITQEQYDGACTEYDYVADIYEDVEGKQEVQNGRQESSHYDMHSFKINLNYHF